jgi:hypothetical protein
MATTWRVYACDKFAQSVIAWLSPRGDWTTDPQRAHVFTSYAEAHDWLGMMARDVPAWVVAAGYGEVRFGLSPTAVS